MKKERNSQRKERFGTKGNTKQADHPNIDERKREERAYTLLRNVRFDILDVAL